MNTELVGLIMSHGRMEIALIALPMIALDTILLIGVHLILRGLGYLEQNLNRLHDRVSKLEKR